MATIVGIVSPVTEVAAGSRPRPIAGDVSAPAVSAAANGVQATDLRLVIEANSQASGGFVYKTLDRRTGEVVNQYPREALMRLKEQSNYQAGAVVSAQA